MGITTTIESQIKLGSLRLNLLWQAHAPDGDWYGLLAYGKNFWHYSGLVHKLDGKWSGWL